MMPSGQRSGRRRHRSRRRRDDGDGPSPVPQPRPDIPPPPPPEGQGAAPFEPQADPASGPPHPGPSAPSGPQATPGGGRTVQPNHGAGTQASGPERRVTYVKPEATGPQVADPAAARAPSPRLAKRIKSRGLGVPDPRPQPPKVPSRTTKRGPLPMTRGMRRRR